MPFEISGRPFGLRRFARIACILFSVTAIGFGQVAPQKTGFTDEAGLRKLISKLNTPTYPKEDIKTGITGVAVAKVELGNRGNVESVDILQAPSATISATVRDALNKSTFSFLDLADPASSLTGKITFYFLRYKGRYVVLNPDEAPKYDELVPRKALPH